jgi:hypothetical protein
MAKGSSVPGFKGSRFKGSKVQGSRVQRFKGSKVQGSRKALLRRQAPVGY